MNATGVLHVIALIFSIYGTYKQIDSVQNNKPYDYTLAVALTVMLLLRIPNQVCISLENFHGWFTVVGTIIGAIGFGYLAYVTYKKNNENKK
tara:strand:+ start:145 stop:420 length:276 start_codon:yes stop_codon:yes gene_type:complete